MTYQTELYKEIFWAESGDFIRGRDPLGIQNSSIATYSNLLPGMTNLTLRIRYYGFYLWLLQEYHSLSEDNPFRKNYQAQYNFIRRAELIVAFVMIKSYPTVLNIVGSDYAFNNQAKLDKGYYDIKLGADKTPESDKLYWRYSSGAFGQYYVGALINFGLVHPNQHLFFIRTEKGNDLANAFKRSFSTEALSAMLKCIDEGKLYPDQIEILQEFAMHKIPPHSEEWSFYQKLLLENDNINLNFIHKQRVETIECFLKNIINLEEKHRWINFPFHIYTQRGFIDKPQQTEASKGWYYFYLNELIHFNLETIFWGLLREMDGRELPAGVFISEVSENVLQQFHFSKDKTISEIMPGYANTGISIQEYLETINQCIKKNESVSAISMAISMLFDLYHRHSPDLLVLEKYASAHFLSDKRGNAMEVFNQIFNLNTNKKFGDFVPNFLIRILNDHIAVALNKMAGREQNLLKFIIEDNRFVHIETMKPNFTSPRLRTLYNFLTDLHFIDETGEVTELGKDLITKLN